MVPLLHAVVSNHDYRCISGGEVVVKQIEHHFHGCTRYVSIKSLSRSSITFMGVPDMCLLNYVCTIYSRIYRSGVAWTSECMRTNS